MKSKIHSSVVEGIVFCGSGLWLLSYSITSQSHAFNKDWSQSPYLFPLIVSLGTILLSLIILYDGIRRMRSSAAAQGEARFDRQKLKKVLVVLLLCGGYYAALRVLKLPYITVGILQFFFTFSTFEIITFLFLIFMMLYMGVRKIRILLPVPLLVTLFLSITFRAMLHVLLP